MERFKSVRIASILGIIGNIFLLVIKSIIGFITNSQAMIADSFNSAGDIFSSILIGKVLSGNRLVDSTRNAMDAVRELIKRNQDNADKYKGIPVENYLEVLD